MSTAYESHFLNSRNRVGNCQKRVSIEQTIFGYGVHMGPSGRLDSIEPGLGDSGFTAASLSAVYSLPILGSRAPGLLLILGEVTDRS